MQLLLIYQDPETPSAPHGSARLSLLREIAMSTTEAAGVCWVRTKVIFRSMVLIRPDNTTGSVSTVPLMRPKMLAPWLHKEKNYLDS